MDATQQKVLEAIQGAGKPVRPGDVAQATGIDKDSVSKAIKALKTSGKIVSPKNCFYAPAE
jgi:Mn-dependent DtxR family transcriptional regulator